MTQLSRAQIKPIALQLYRAGILIAIIWLIHAHRVKLRLDADRPVNLSEAQQYFSKAARLEQDNDRLGLRVMDADGAQIGYLIRTRPVCDSIIGYAGPTDTLIVFDANSKCLGIKIRHSPDTFTHVGDVQRDEYFMNTWNGKTWDEIAAMDLKKAGIEGVSGATMTSMSMAQSITYRLRFANKELFSPPPLKFGMRDIGILGVMTLATLVAFTNLRGKKGWRTALQLIVIGYLGFFNGDLIAQSLLNGWAASAIPWRNAPGLVLLVAAALVIPWTTRRPLYCQYICPHGAAQELMHRVGPKFLRLNLPKSLSSALRWLPMLLLALALGTTMLLLPLDLAGIEPFDAYLIKSAGWATIAIACLGLVASLFVPMAYCKFGCPTGALLEFLRSHGRADRFGRRDFAALFLVLWVAILFLNHDTFLKWIAGV